MKRILQILIIRASPADQCPNCQKMCMPCRHRLDRKSGSAAVSCGINMHCFASATKAAVARLIGTDGAEEVNLAKSRPQHIREVELAVHALPEQEA